MKTNIVKKYFKQKVDRCLLFLYYTPIPILLLFLYCTIISRLLLATITALRVRYYITFQLLLSKNHFLFFVSYIFLRNLQLGRYFVSYKWNTLVIFQKNSGRARIIIIITIITIIITIPIYDSFQSENIGPRFLHTVLCCF